MTFTTLMASGTLDLILIIRTVAGSILEVFFLCLVGYLLARKQIINSQSKTTLNQINVAFFTPALMFSKVAFSLTIDKLAELYIVPIGFVITTALSALLAHVISRFIFRLPKPETKYCIAVSMFMNSNSLPIALVTSLIGHLNGTTNGLEWGENDTKDKQMGRSITYLVVFSTLGLVLRWSYGVSLLSASIPKAVSEEEQGQARKPKLPLMDSESTRLLYENDNEDGDIPDLTVTSLKTGGDTQQPASPPALRRSTHQSSSRSPSAVSFAEPITPTSQRRLRRTSSVTTITTTSSTSPHLLRPPTPLNDHDTGDGRTLRRPIFHSFPNVAVKWVESIASSSKSRRSSIASLSSEGAEPNEDDLPPDQATRNSELTSRHQLRSTSCFSAHSSLKYFKRLVLRPLRRVHQFMTPPLYASLLSLVVVCIPPLQDWLEDIDPLRSALKSAGNVSVPLTLVVLGAYFYDDPKPKINTAQVNATGSSGEQRESGDDEEPFESQKRKQIRQRSDRKTVISSILSRQIMTPIIQIPLLYLILEAISNSSISNSKSSPVHEDPCFILVSVLLIGAPPAITLAQMTNSNPYPIRSDQHRRQEILNHRFQRLISRTLLVSYVFITPITTVLLVVAGILVVRAVG